MPKKFFSSWEIWEKLVFILACAIVVTVFLGSLKLAYTHWRLRKYAVVEQEKKEQAMQRQMSQRRRQVQNNMNDEVPFGIRAIESGIEVEGVWISRSNTPEPKSRDTSAPSSIYEPGSWNGLQHDIEKQVSIQDQTSSASKSRPTQTQYGRSSVDRAVSAEREPVPNVGREFGPDALTGKAVRSRHPPLSYNRYNGNPYLLRDSSPAKTLQGLEAIHRASTSFDGYGAEDSTESSGSSYDSSNTTGDIEPISASAPTLLTAPQKSKRRQYSTSDLELLNSHRLSLAAETGQLAPRERRPVKSFSVDLNACSGRTSNSGEREDYFGSQRQSPSSPDGWSVQPLSRPKIAALPPAIRRASMPDVTPFAQFCKMAPPSPQPMIDHSRSAITMPGGSPRSNTSNLIDLDPPSPVMLASDGAAALKLPPPERPSFEKRISQVVRGHGSGFEILRPGSLKPPLPKEHPMQKQQAAPPVSLQNGSRERSSSAECRRKLQKKRRPSDVSMTSSVSSRMSQISLL